MADGSPHSPLVAVENGVTCCLPSLPRSAGHARKPITTHDANVILLDRVQGLCTDLHLQPFLLFILRQGRAKLPRRGSKVPSLRPRPPGALGCRRALPCPASKSLFHAVLKISFGLSPLLYVHYLLLGKNQGFLFLTVTPLWNASPSAFSTLFFPVTPRSSQFL